MRSISGWRARSANDRRARNPAELGHARARGLPEQQHDRDRRATARRWRAPIRARRERRDRHEELRPAEVPDVRSAAMSTRLITAASTIAASTGCGRFRSRPEANSTTISVKSGGDQTRQRRARAGALVDERLRHAAAHREAATEPARGCRRRSPGAPGSRRTDSRASARTCGRSRTSRRRRGRSRQRERQELVQIRRLTCGSPRQGRPCGTSPEQRHARAPRDPGAAPRGCRRPPRETPPAGSSARACRRMSTASATSPPAGDAACVAPDARGSTPSAPRSRRACP